MSQEAKISPEEKVKIVEQVLHWEISQAEAARQNGVSKAAVREWIARYQAEGPSAFQLHEKPRVYTTELKLAAVRDYLAGNESLLEICKKYKIRSKCQLRYWIRVYNVYGDLDSIKHLGGESCMNQGRDTTQEERIQIARESLSSGKNYGAIAEKYNVSYQQARSWTKKYEKLGEAGLEDHRGQRTRQQEPRTPEEEFKRKIAQLEHENYLLKVERDLLKKLNELERRDALDK